MADNDKQFLPIISSTRRALTTLEEDEFHEFSALSSNTKHGQAISVSTSSTIEGPDLRFSAGATADETTRHSLDTTTDRRSQAICEAAEMYGDIATAEGLGYVERGLKGRHIQFIALASTIGTGLFLGIGRALVQAGPLSLFLGYSITGFFIYCLTVSLGEMATWLPIPGATPQFCARYVDPALGFALGWHSWYAYAITVCTEISAASVIIDYWEGARGINVGVWIAIMLIAIICLNIMTVSYYGEAEFWFASIKIVTILGLLMFALVIDLGGGPTHDRLGFRYWKTPGAMKAFVADGVAGRFLGFFSTLINATFAYGAVEVVGVAGGEVKNPRKNIPKAVRRVFWRILLFYVLGALAVGVLVPYNEPRLLDALEHKAPGAAASPWVIAIYRAGVPALPSILNTVILTSAVSAGNGFLYGGSRFLFALAQNGQAPKLFMNCSKRGIPYNAIAATASITLLTFLSCSQTSAQVFIWFQNIVAISALLIWISIITAYLKFFYALRAQNIPRSSLPYKSWGQPYTAWATLGFFAIVLLFNGFWTFPSPTRSFNVAGFLTAYIELPIFMSLYVFWKFWKRTRWLKSEEVDLATGKAAIDAAEISELNAEHQPSEGTIYLRRLMGERWAGKVERVWRWAI